MRVERRGGDQRIINAAIRAGIEGFRSHDARHTAAGWMVMKGIDLYLVQPLLASSESKVFRSFQRWTSPEA
ncbi:MAG: tyrosine-type recombinase/integrase [Pseudomonadota bacterium]